MRFLGGLLALALVLAAGGLAFIYSGIFNVAATTPHTEVAKWILSTTMESSVERRARDVAVPASLDDRARFEEGFSAYEDMCVACHAAPGVERSAIGKGLNPEPPELHEEAEDWSRAELFWITRNGIRMSGMPAFGPTHSDEEIWELVAFVQRLPDLSPEDYAELRREAEERGAGEGHDHGRVGRERPDGDGDEPFTP